MLQSVTQFPSSIIGFPQHHPSCLLGTPHSPLSPDPDREGSCPEGQLDTGEASPQPASSFP